MKKYFPWFPALLLVLTTCTKQEIIRIDLKGAISGNVTTQNEKSLQVDDAGGILVELEGSEPVLSALTDVHGDFVINDIPTGTYNITVSKEGYGTVVRQGFSLVGGDKTLYTDMRLYEVSKTTLLNLSLDPGSGSTVLLSGKINHSFTTEDFRRPYIRYFLGKTGAVTPSDYTYTYAIEMTAASGEEFSLTINVPTSLFPSGSDLYLTACGTVQNDYGYYDIETNRYLYSSLGPPSGVVHVTLP